MQDRRSKRIETCFEKPVGRKLVVELWKRNSGESHYRARSKAVAAFAAFADQAVTPLGATAVY